MNIRYSVIICIVVQATVFDKMIYIVNKILNKTGPKIES